MKPHERSRRQPRRMGGFTLIDVLVVIVVMAVLAAALVTTAGRMAEQSARTLKTRQVWVFAQALLEEVRHMPFTFCDGVASTNADRTGCAVPDALGIEGAETRFAANAANRFDGVTDYWNFAMPGPGCAGLCDITGAVVNGPGSPLSGCDRANVLVLPTAMGGIPANDGLGGFQVLLIRVIVNCPGQPPVVTEGIRVRHAPNSF